MSPKIVHTTDNSLLDVVQKLLRPRHQPLRRLHADAVGDTAERHWRQSPRHVGTRVAPIKAGELDDTLALLRREPVAASYGGASRQQARQEGQQLRCELSTCVPRDARGGAVRLRGGGGGGGGGGGRCGKWGGGRVWGAKRPRTAQHASGVQQLRARLRKAGVPPDEKRSGRPWVARGGGGGASWPASPRGAKDVASRSDSRAASLSAPKCAGFVHWEKRDGAGTRLRVVTARVESEATRGMTAGETHGCVRHDPARCAASDIASAASAASSMSPKCGR